MGPAPHLGKQVRRALHLMVVLATAAMLALPMLFGPGTAGLVRALGGTPEHTCACGMKVGKCSCPECADKAKADFEDSLEAPRVAIKSTCDDDNGMPAFDALPAVALASSYALPPLPAVPTLHVVRPDHEPPLVSFTPPTPPPRRAAA